MLCYTMSMNIILCYPTNPVFLAWTAAWLESEGNLSLFRRNDIGQRSFQIKVTISQANTEPLEMIASGFPFGRICRSNDHSVSLLEYSSTKAVDFLLPLLPYMTFKRERADILIEAQSIISKRYNRWHQRPDEEIERLLYLKNRLHEITRTSLVTRQKMIGGRGNKLLNRWSQKHERCVICGTTEIKHCAKGMCHQCYSRTYVRASREHHAVGAV